MWEMYDDIPLHIARLCTSFPVRPLSMISSLILYNHILLGLPPSLPTPLYFNLYCPPSYVVRISSHHMPIKLQPHYLHFHYFHCPVILPILTLSSIVTQQSNRSTRIYATSNLFSRFNNAESHFVLYSFHRRVI